MPETRIRKSYRMTVECLRNIREIAKHQGGLTDTRVIEWAVERLHSDIAVEIGREIQRKNSQKSKVPS